LQDHPPPDALSWLTGDATARPLICLRQNAESARLAFGAMDRPHLTRAYDPSLGRDASAPERAASRAAGLPLDRAPTVGATASA
jgi:hypothetical protein